MYVNQHVHGHHVRDTALALMRVEHQQYLRQFFDCWVLWVRHPLSHIWWPWLVQEQDYRLWRAVVEGTSLSTSQVQRARELQLLLDESELCSALPVGELAAAYAEQGYVVVPNLVPKHYYAVVDYWTSIVGPSLGGDDQVPGRLAHHNCPLFSPTHAALAQVLQGVVRQAVKPSYCYYGHYPKGSELRKHVDRAQCEWNMSIVFSRAHEDRSRAASWPIFVEIRGMAHRIEVPEGWGIVYKGTEIPHWREPLEHGYATACFYHFVKPDFRGQLT